MPPAVLRARIIDAVHNRMDMSAWRHRMQLDSAEKVAIERALTSLGRDEKGQQEREQNAWMYQLAYGNREDET